MRGNPEFVRNVWIEITPQRLIVMPAVIGVVFLLVFLINDRTLDFSTAQAAVLMFAGIVFIWGSRVASDAVVQEINARTWDSQRMSALDPWTLAWGKLFGSTAYVWYGGLICMALYGISYAEVIPTVLILKFIALYVGCGVLSHAVGLLVSLQAVQKRREFGRIQITFYQFLGLATGLPTLYIGLRGVAEDGIYRVAAWYDHVFPLLDFTLVFLVAYIAWGLVGIYRSMRSELQVVNGPWVWLGFVAFAAVHIAGLRFLPEEVGRVLPSLTGKVFAGFFVLVVLTYVAAISEPKGRLVFRQLRQHLRLGDWAGFINRLPLCIPTVLLALAVGALLVRIGESKITLFTIDINFKLAVLATSLFVLRDVGVIIFINLLRPSPRADMTAFVCLAVSYTLIPAALAAVALDPLTAFFWPKWNAGPALTIIPVTIEAAIVAVLLYRQWRRAVADDEDVY